MSTSASVSNPQPATTITSVPPAKTSGRMVSLDVFRGLTIAGMILVNNPGNGHAYAPLKHAAWNGWTPTDLIFPFFLFIVGVSLVLSFASRLNRGASRSELLAHSLKRAAIIFAIGVALNAFPYYHVMPIRFVGVLQRIGLAYGAAALITLWTGRRGRIIAAVALIGGYWALMRFVPVPGFGIPGRDIPLLDPDRNWAALFDQWIVPGRLYLGTSDPEGFLSTFPAIGTVLLGVLTGEWLRSKATPTRKAIGMFAWGAAGLLAGKLFDVWMPINKNLWTSSFVLFTAGFALIVLAACYWLIDVRGWRGKWTEPFLVFGTNAIVAYTLASLTAKIIYRTKILGGTTSIQRYIFDHVFAPLGNPSFTSLLFSLAFVAVCAIPVWVLYRKGIFIKI
ncbi:MAG TPA: heparan-alpha-glucosaminide N-acetyltransferase domain-containing protein [Terriglobales bacterium]|nr:heparan-alpha-glucosaminide N-acetyltransferase domain-containing protein [Terriglobales bacterium]